VRVRSAGDVLGGVAVGQLLDVAFELGGLRGILEHVGVPDADLDAGPDLDIRTELEVLAEADLAPCPRFQPEFGVGRDHREPYGPIGHLLAKEGVLIADLHDRDLDGGPVLVLGR
jgi:hypothetical protein